MYNITEPPDRESSELQERCGISFEDADANKKGLVVVGYGKDIGRRKLEIFYQIYKKDDPEEILNAGYFCITYFNKNIKPNPAIEIDADGDERIEEGILELLQKYTPNIIELISPTIKP